MAGNLELVKDSLLKELVALDGLKGDDLKEEISRARAKVEVAAQVNGYVSNQISLTKLAVRVKGDTSRQAEWAMDRMLGLPEPNS